MEKSLLREQIAEQAKKDDTKRYEYMRRKKLIYCEYSKEKTEECNEYDSEKEMYYREILPELTDSDREEIDKLMCETTNSKTAIFLYVISALMYFFVAIYALAVAIKTEDNGTIVALVYLAVGAFPSAVLLGLAKIINCVRRYSR